MILQCDQCNTKFRLDDAKLKPGGVKVRCSKCRHVFVAGAELKHEESEFDAILSGLGAPAPKQTEEAAAPGMGGDLAGDLAGFSFDEEPQGAPSPAEPASDVSEPFPAEAATPDSAAFEPAAPAVAAFEQAEFTADSEAVRHATEESPAQSDLAGFADFDFPSEPVEPSQAPQQPASLSQSELESALDFSALDLKGAPPLPRETREASAPQGLEYGEFAFDEEPAPLQEEPAAAPTDAFSFGEFSFSNEPVPSQQAAAPVSPPALDFGEFDFEAEPAAPPAEPQRQEPAAASDELDYGDFSFESDATLDEASKTAPAVEETATAAEESFDFGAFNFSEEPVLQQKEPASAEQDGLDFGEFSFDEEPVLPKEPSVPSTEPAANEAAAEQAAFPEAVGSFSEAVPPKQGGTAPVADGFDFDNFSFPQDSDANSEAAASLEEPPAEIGPEAAGLAETAAASDFTAQVPPPPKADPTFAFDSGAAPISSRVPDYLEVDEDLLPPLSIASRRKGRSILTVSVIAISVLVIVALSGAGFYLLQSGPAAFDKLGIGFVAKWFGMESVEEGRITIKNQQASFIQNKEAGELFVVTGEAVNSFRKARASIHVKVSLFDKKGAVLLQKTAYCGNRLSSEQLATLPMSKIESTMNNQFGDSLANLGVPPGGAIGFVVAIPNVPKEAADFGVEVIGSTVAGK